MFVNMDLFRKQLKHPVVARERKKFTPFLVRQYVWAILCEYRQYFGQQVSYKDRVSSTGPVWPASLMGNLLGKVMNLEPCTRVSFPEKWKTKNYGTGAAGGNYAPRL